MKLGLIQTCSSTSMADNISAVSALVREAAEAGADLVVTPETTHLMVSGRKQSLAHACQQDLDPGLSAFCALAGELGIWLCIGSLMIRKDGDRLANRSFMIGPDGVIKATYDKIHLFDVELGSGESYRESALYDPGEAPVIARTPHASIGMTICYDVRFPALYNALACAGAQVITIPAAFTVPTGKTHWHALARSRAIETGCWIIAPAQSGKHENGRSTFGHSLVISPWGEIVLDAGTETGAWTVEIDLEKCEEARSLVPNLKHGRDLKPVNLVDAAK